MKRRKFLRNGFIASLVAAFGFPLVANDDRTIPKPSNKPTPETWSNEKISISWIGHSTVLIKLFDKIILTDPIFFTRMGIYFAGLTFGPNRYTAPALDFDEIPKPDIILLSHAHMDHMDYKTLMDFTGEYPNQIDCITAFNTMDVIDHFDWKSIREMDWNQELDLNGIHFRALQVKHFGWRYPWEHDRSKGYFENGRSFNAYIISLNGKKVLFGGDTALCNFFKESKEEVDIAIMPIGAYNPWRMNHCNPEEALQMAHDVKAKVFIPIHCNTFKQGTEPVDEPLQLLTTNNKRFNISIGITGIGQTYQTS